MHWKNLPSKALRKGKRLSRPIPLLLSLGCGFLHAGSAPFLEMKFHQNSGTSLFNTGTMGTTASLSAPNPTFSANTPTGGGAYAIDIGSAGGTSAVDLLTGEVLNAAKDLKSFTIMGWLNCRSATTATGGNRIVSWYQPLNSGDGVDLAMTASGALSLGIKSRNDVSGIVSNGGKVTVDGSTGAGNWRFFAVTYDGTLSTGQVKFYFGTSAASAQLDRTFTYNQGTTGSTIAPSVTLGNISTATRSSSNHAAFRGLMDEMRVFGSKTNSDGALALAAIQTYQGISSQTGQVGLVYQRWNGISGTTIANLTSNSRFPGSPDETQNRPTFEGFVNAGDNFGIRISGWIKAPETGDYIFGLTSDDAGEVWLSSNDDPANKRLILSNPTWTSPSVWAKQSTPIQLVVGKFYYVEALMKEGSGGDHLKVGWRRPMDTQVQVIGAPALFVTPPAVEPGIDPLAWQYSKFIRLNTLTGPTIGNDVLSVPILIRLNSRNFEFAQANASGNDIRFEYLGKILKYEIESWDYKGKSADIWVLMPVVKAGSVTQKIKMYWGNPAAASASSGSDVFSSSNAFAGVWHLAEKGNTQTGGFKDATPNQNHGTGYGLSNASSVNGISGLAQKFDGTSSYIDAGNRTSLDIGASTDRLTFSAWVNFAPEAFQSQYSTVMSKGDHSYHMHHSGVDKSVQAIAYDGGWRRGSMTYPIAADRWYHLAGTVNGTEISLYVNGEKQTDVTAMSGFLGTTFSFNIGRNSETGNRYFKGILDEITVSSAARSVDWIKLNYECQREGQKFVAVPELVRPARLENGLLALYDFKSDIGSKAYDISGVLPMLDLTILNTANTEWYKDGGLDVKSGTLLSTGVPATKVNQVIAASGEFSAELWIDPKDSAQGSSNRAQLLTLSSGSSARNLTISQIGKGVQVALRTTETNSNGSSPFFFAPDVLDGKLAHLVFSFASDGQARLYVNGREIPGASLLIPGGLSNWGDFQLAFGNEVGGTSNPWLGTYYAAALYGKALSLQEVQQNFDAGALGTVSFAQAILNKSAMSYDMALLEDFKLTAAGKSIYLSNASIGKLKVVTPFRFFAGESRSIIAENSMDVSIGALSQPFESLAMDNLNNPKKQLLKCRHLQYVGEEVLEGQAVHRLKADNYRLPWYVLGIYPETDLGKTDVVTLWIGKDDFRIRKIEFEVDDKRVNSPILTGVPERIVGKETYSVDFGPCIAFPVVPVTGGYRYLKIEVGNPGSTERDAALTEIEWMSLGTSYPIGEMTSNTSLSPVKVINLASEFSPDGWQLFDGDKVDNGLGFRGDSRVLGGLILDLGPTGKLLPDKFRMSINEEVASAPMEFRLLVSNDTVNWTQALAVNNLAWTANETKEWNLDFNQMSAACVPGRMKISNPTAVAAMTSAEKTVLQTHHFQTGDYIDGDVDARLAQMSASLPRTTEADRLFVPIAEDFFKTAVENMAGLRYWIKDAFANTNGPLIVDFTATGDRTKRSPGFFE